MATGQAVSYGISNPLPSIPHVSEIPYVGKFISKRLSVPIGKTWTIFYLDVEDERYFFESENRGLFVSLSPISATKYTIHTRHNVTKEEVVDYMEGRSLALSVSVYSTRNSLYLAQCGTMIVMMRQTQAFRQHMEMALL